MSEVQEGNNMQMLLVMAKSSTMDKETKILIYNSNWVCLMAFPDKIMMKSSLRSSHMITSTPI